MYRKPGTDFRDDATNTAEVIEREAKDLVKYVQGLADHFGEISDELASVKKDLEEVCNQRDGLIEQTEHDRKWIKDLMAELEEYKSLPEIRGYEIGKKTGIV